MLIKEHKNPKLKKFVINIKPQFRFNHCQSRSSNEEKKMKDDGEING